MMSLTATLKCSMIIHEEAPWNHINIVVVLTGMVSNRKLNCSALTIVDNMSYVHHGTVLLAQNNAGQKINTPSSNGGTVFPILNTGSYLNSFSSRNVN
jgi:hypothetical protein